MPIYYFRQTMEKKSHFLQKIFDPKKFIFYKKAKKIESFIKLIFYIFHHFTNKNTYVYKYL